MTIRIIFEDEAAYDEAIREAREKAWDEAADHLESRYDHEAAFELRLANPERKEEG